MIQLHVRKIITGFNFVCLNLNSFCRTIKKTIERITWNISIVVSVLDRMNSFQCNSHLMKFFVSPELASISEQLQNRI